MSARIFSYCSIANSDGVSAYKGDLIRQHADEALNGIEDASAKGYAVSHLSTTYGDGLLLVTVVMEKASTGPVYEQIDARLKAVLEASS